MNVALPRALPVPPVILIVDAEVLVRMVLADYLRACGYKAIEAASGAEALLVLQEPEVSVDIVLSDVEMPGDMDGFGLARWIRQNKPLVAVILAGTHQRAAEASGELCEKGPHLAKPYDHQVIVQRIHSLLAERDASKKG